jgi:hypothetical protein
LATERFHGFPEGSESLFVMHVYHAASLMSKLNRLKILSGTQGAKKSNKRSTFLLVETTEKK